jgi:hypothetical protein
MNDPRRLLEDASLSDVERRSLSAALSDEPPSELVSEVWSGIGAAIGSGAAGAAAAGVGQTGAKAGAASVAGTGGKVALVKALVVGVTVGAVTAGGAVALAPSPPQPVASAAASAPVPAPRPETARRGREGANTPQVIAEPSALPELRGRRPAAPSVTASSVAPAASDAVHGESSASSVAGFDTRGATPAAQASGPADTDRARAEARLVGEARDALRQHDAAGALAVLGATERRFPDGILLQEREALTISALAELGRSSEASARARAFLRAFPSSPHAERVRRAVGER